MRFRDAVRIGLVGVAIATAANPSRAEESRMTGRVIDAETQASIADAEVEVANASGGTGFFRGRTNRAGEFRLEGIVAERYYTLTVGAEGYADFVLGGWRFPAAQRAVDVVIPLDRAGSIEAHVTTTDGRTPVPNARVSVRSEGSTPWWEGYRPPPAPVYADAKGVATFRGLTAGYWTVTADVSGRLPFEARRVAVRRGDVSRVPIALARPASVSGVVRLADGTGVAGVSVVARGPAEGVGTTDAEGGFTVPDLPPGKYRIEVQPDGFQPTRTREPVTLAEGESKAGVTLIVTPRDPELSFVLNREVFAPDEPAKVGVRSFRIGGASMILYRIPNERVLDTAQDFRRYAQGPDTTGLRRERSWTHTPPDGPPFTWRDEEVTIAEKPTAGVYLLSARAAGLERRVIFFVSELGLIVKRSPAKLLVSAASLTTSVQAPGVAIFTTPVARSTVQRPPGEGWLDALREARRAGSSTGAEGLLEIPIAAGTPRLRIVGVSEKLGVSVVEAPLASAAEQGGDQVFLYTERPIYRPGQTVFWKLFARKAEGSGYAMPDATGASLALTGPDGTRIEVPAAALSRRGTADGSIALGTDLPLGDWSLSARVGGATGTATIGVQQYRKPEFRVDVAPDREVYVNGDEVRFTIAATYFFGAPVFGAAVRYNLFESRIHDADEEGGWDELAEAPVVGFGRVLKTGEARTDADGRLALTFVPDRVAYDRRLTLEVEIVDPANRMVRGRGSAVMGRGLFTVDVRPVSRLVNVGEPILIEVATRDHTGKPVSAAVTVELDQDAWNPIERRTTRSTRPLASTQVTTAANGRASVSLTPTPARSGEIRVRARAEDAKGNRIADEATLWVYDWKVWQYAYRYPALEAFADRPRYAVGDTARIVVNTDVAYATVLATVEGREIENVRVVHLFGNTGRVDFPIRREYAPNVYVSLHVRKGREVRTRVLDLPVASARHDLVIDVRPDRASYRPGDRAQVRITSRDPGGAPAPAELSLGVVDEAIYSLRPDATPQPHDVFYGHRPNWVSTAVSFPSLTYGGAEKEGRDEVRRDFRDVAFWAPVIQTDAVGNAEVSFEFPDNLTTWRLTSRGATDDTRVGVAVAKTLVTKDLVARLALPRFFVAGDQAALVSVVTNRTPNPLVAVKEALEARGPVKIVGSTSAETSIPARGESRHEWTVEVARELPATADTLEATFVHRARSAADSDALEVGAPVRPRAVSVASHGAGNVDRGEATVEVPLPGDLIRNGSEVRIDLSPSPAGMMVAAADGLHAYEWRCTEQTANALRGAVAMLSALGTAANRPPGWESPERKLAPLIRRLLELQNQEGAWGWWGGGDSDPYMTVLALDALARLAALKLETEDLESSMQRASNQLPRLLYEVRTLDGEAYCLAHLTPMLALPEATNRFTELRSRLEELALSIHAGRARLSNAGVALAALGHADLGRQAEARALLELSMSRAVKEGGLHWTADPGWEQGWFGDDEENTAYALSALVTIAPQDARAGEIVQWLARRRRGLLWRSTRVTGPVAIALADYVTKHPAEARPEYRLRIQWNGETVLERAVTRADLFGGRELRVRIPGKSLRPGVNRLVLSRQGTGSIYYAWEAQSMVPSPGPPLARDLPLQITREILHAERTADRRGRPRFLATPAAAGEPFRVGEQVLVRLRLRATKPLRHLIVQDPRIAGFEVDALLPEGTEWPWNAHGEERDDRVAFFLEWIDEGETLIEYLVRPEIPGTFTGLPTEAGGMYLPELRARGAEARIEVRGK